MTGNALDLQSRLSPCLEWIFAEAEKIEDRIAAAAKNGMRQVEFWYWRRRSVDSLVEALGLAGIGVSAVVVDPQANIADRNTHKVWLENVLASAEVAAHLGSPILVATTGARVMDGPNDREQLKVASEALAEAARLAESHGVRLALEPLNDRTDHPGTLLTSSLLAGDIIDIVGSKALGILFDIYHSHAMGEDVVAMIEALGSRIIHVQVADDPGRNEPGSGRIAWGPVMMALQRIGYEGKIGLEYRPTRSSAESVMSTLQALSHSAQS